MKNRHFQFGARRSYLLVLLGLSVVALFAGPVFSQAIDSARITVAADKVLTAAAKNTNASPGCAVGISHDGRSVYERAFGMADLEHSIPNKPTMIFEAGSVAKQFTAGAAVLLALDGKLNLDDPVKKYIPEIPDYGKPLTIRHLITHTGGLRDWGTVLELTGFGRGNRMITQDLAFDIVTNQRALDFTPGAEYSYSNSGYTLLSTIVERVSKQSLPAFTAERFFKPLGMTNTTWRDDYRRIVPGRVQAYSPAGEGSWRLDMPFMNVYGNGGMLTTVGDWLKWNAAFDSQTFGAKFVEAMETTGVLNDGRKITYALGITVNSYKGLRQVAHSGSTAGYSTYLARYPELRISVAVLCNGPTFNPTALAQRLIDEIAGPLPNAPSPETKVLSADELQKHVSLWRSEKTHMPFRTSFENGSLRIVGGPVLRPLADGSFQMGQGASRLQFDAGTDKSAKIITGDDVEQLIPESEWSPTPEELKMIEGVWHSDEAGASFTVNVEDTQAFLIQRPATRLSLRPLFKDHFSIANLPGRVMWFTRNNAGRLSTMHIGASRMRDMHFTRVLR